MTDLFSLPKKSLGQNFLVDQNYKNKIIQAVKSIYQDQVILEIGPGRGALTKELLAFSSQMIVVEKDKELAKHLQTQFQGSTSLTIYCDDFLEFDLTQLPDKNIIVVSNLPYNVASQILIRLFENKNRFTHFFLMFQKEVAKRCVAVSNTQDYSMLSIWSWLFSQPKILFDLPPSVFVPQPKITSSFVEFVLNNEAFIKYEKFLPFVRTLFTYRRKKIGTILKKQNLILPQNLSDELQSLIDQRAESLSIQQLHILFIAMTLK